MANWVYPLGTATHGKWDVSIGTSDSRTGGGRLGPYRTEGRHPGGGGAVELDAAAEERSWCRSRLLRGGRGRQDYPLAGRDSVFSGPSDVLYTAPARPSPSARPPADGWPWAPAPAKPSYPARLITPPRRRWNCAARVTAPGRSTTSAPPPSGGRPLHRLRGPHPGRQLVDLSPAQARRGKGRRDQLEEIYYFETRGRGAATPGGRRRHRLPARLRLRRTAHRRVGRGPHRRRRPGAQRLARARHGSPRLRHVLPQRHGRPGPVRDWLISDDPHHGWIRQTWESQDLDPRLPFGR